MDKIPGELLSSVQADEPSGNPREPSFFLTHGAGGDLSSAGLVAFSSALAERGHLCVRANLPYRIAGRKTPPAAEKSVDGFARAFESAKARWSSASWVAGGRSYGGRVASMAGLDVAGLMFFPYPLHRPGDPSSPRASHWPAIKVPCLFVQGTRDPFCDLDVLQKLLPAVAGKATLLVVEGGDHSLKVRASNSPTGRALSEAAVVEEIMPAIGQWLDGL